MVQFHIGLAERKGVSDTVYSVTVNGIAGEAGIDESESVLVANAARTISFAYPHDRLSW